MIKTKDYYNLISNYLVADNNENYYNGSLIIDDFNSDPESFVDQDVNNVIKLSKLGKNILEFGCGSGYFFKKLIQKNPDINYTGIDISENQIKNAKLINPEHKDNFSVLDWESGLPFESNSFDTLLFLETIGYTKNLNNLLKECHRVLKPNGTLFSKHPGCIKNKPSHMYYTKKMLSKFAEEYGYESDSLGMMMNVNFFIESLKKHNFDASEGFNIPKIDNSLHIKSFYVEEFRPYMENYIHNSKILSTRVPVGIPKNFEWNNIKNDLGKLHPILCEMLMSRNKFYDGEGFHCDDETHIPEEIYHSCVTITAYKK